MPSFYTPDLKIDDEKLTITAEEFHHIVNVFRHKRGDVITLNNGQGILAQATIELINKKDMHVKIISKKYYEQKKPEIFVLFALLRNKNDHLLVEKITELGVNELLPFTSDRTVKTGHANTAEKIQKVSISAIKQCDNCWLPIINHPMKLEESIYSLQVKYGQDILLIAALERDSTQLINECLPKELPSKIGIIIGPEGGFSDTEIQMLSSKPIPFITLGRHVLRAETAAITAVAQLLLCINNKVSDYY